VKDKNLTKFAVLGSGSKANSYVFSNNYSSCIIDNGYSFYQFTERAKSLEFDLNKFKFILVTHTHNDHINGVRVCAKKLKIPIYIHKDSDYLEYFKIDKQKEKLDIRLIESDILYKHESFSFIAFETSHDAKASVSYSLNFNNITFTIITDTGKISKKMFYYAKNSDVLFLEANYNPQKLIDGPYPLYLKERIKSENGHLSNIESIKFLNFLSNQETKIKHVYFCHLSEINNSPEILKEDIIKYGNFKFPYIICPRNHMQMGKEIDDFNLLKSNIVNIEEVFNHFKENLLF